MIITISFGCHKVRIMWIDHTRYLNKIETYSIIIKDEQKPQKRKFNWIDHTRIRLRATSIVISQTKSKMRRSPKQENNLIHQQFSKLLSNLQLARRIQKKKEKEKEEENEKCYHIKKKKKVCHYVLDLLASMSRRYF